MGAFSFVPVEVPAALVVRFGRDQGRQEDVPEPVDAGGVQVGVREVELEATAEVFDLPLQLAATQRGNGGGRFLETST